MIDRTQKPSKFAKGAACYNEFRCNKPGWTANFCGCWGGSNTDTVGVEIVGRETTVLENCSQLYCEIVPCKPLTRLDEGEKRLAWWWPGLKELVFHGHHGTYGWRGLCYCDCVTLSEELSFGLFDADGHVAGWMGVGYQCDVIEREVDRGVERAIARKFARSCLKNPKKARRKAAQSITWSKL